MFPQLPFGFQNNVRLYEATTALQLGRATTTAFVGEVRDLFADLSLSNVDIDTNVQALRFAESLLDIKPFTTTNITSSVKSADSLLSIGGLNIETMTALQPSDLWDFNAITTALWLDPTDASTITESGGLLSQINDKSGNARNATASGSPAISSGIISFDGADDFLEIPSSTGLFNAFHQTGGSIFAVMRSAGGNVVILDNHGTASSQTGFSFYTFPQLYYFAGRGVSGQPTFNLIGSSPTTGQFNILEGISTINPSSTTGTTQGYINGTLDVTVSQLNLPAMTNASQNLVIGRIAGTGLYYAFELLELVLIEGAVTTDIRQKAEGRLAHKHGLTARLASDHPYKSVPPSL